MIIEIKGTRQDAKKNYQKGLFGEWSRKESSGHLMTGPELYPI